MIGYIGSLHIIQLNSLRSRRLADGREKRKRLHKWL